MEYWLFNILRDGTLLDNQLYQANKGILTNHRIAEDIHLLERGSRYRKPLNNEEEIWRFLNTCNSEINSLLAEKNNEAVVLFNEQEYEHNTTDNFIELSGIDSRNFTLNTGNIIGFAKKGEYALKISSRFGDEFLKHIIADADGFLELKDFGETESGEGYEWLLIYLWKIKLKKAFRLGLPKQYQTHNENLSKVRGQIDPVDYFLNTNSGKYLCSYREHSYNNMPVRLIAEVFKKIKGNDFMNDMHMVRNTFTFACNGIRSRVNDLMNTGHFTNPFYQDYNDVIDLSKLLLRDDKSDFTSDSESSAFFFDVSMLFEYYVKKLLIRGGITVQSKKSERLEISTGHKDFKRKLEPDIVFEQKGGVYVFDVKYKYFDFIKYGSKREDLFQLHTYIGQYGNRNKIKGCGFIYPLTEDRWQHEGNGSPQAIIRKHVQIMGKNIPFYIFFILIPKGTDKKIFHENFSKNSTSFLNLMKSI